MIMFPPFKKLVRNVSSCLRGGGGGGLSVTSFRPLIFQCYNPTLPMIIINDRPLRIIQYIEDTN